MPSALSLHANSNRRSRSAWRVTSGYFPHKLNLTRGRVIAGQPTGFRIGQRLAALAPLGAIRLSPAQNPHAVISLPKTGYRRAVSPLIAPLP